MKKTSLNPGTILGPLPAALVSLGTMEKSNLITIAWTGIVNTKPPMTYISVRPERYSYNILKERNEFVINLCSSHMAKRVDICGMKTGAKGDKFKICGLTKEKAVKLEDCPIVSEAPINIECKVVEAKELGSHTMFLAEIVNVNVNEDLIDEKGRLNIRKADILGYMHGQYTMQGRAVGDFGFSARKKEKKS